MRTTNALSHGQVLNSLASSWQMLTGSRLVFSEYEAPFRARRDDHYYVMTLRWRGGWTSTVGLQIADRNLVGLAATMFGESAGEIDADKADDAGKELCNILGACCIGLFSDPGQIDFDVPQRMAAPDFGELLSSGCMAYRFGAERADGAPVISIISLGSDVPRSEP